jgi:hypothetical protein
LDITPDGYAEFPEECEDLEKEFLHKLNTWYGSNCVRRFTTEYYAKRIDILSSKTRKAQREIDIQMNTITRACTIDGKPHTELLGSQKLKQLKILYRKKSQLSNPYDEFGNLKEEGTDEYQIAKELTEWNLFTKDKIQYTTDYESFNAAKANSSDPDLFE